MVIVVAICCALAVFMLFQPFFKAGKYKDFNRSLGNFRN